MNDERDYGIRFEDFPAGSEIKINEDYAALQFARIYADLLRYDHNVGKWYQWVGSHWKQNQTKLAFTWARNLARKLTGGFHAQASKASFAAAVERYAQADTQLAVTQEVWDADPFLLGTPDGTVDLKTGVLRKADPDDMITKTTAVAPAATADCPLWLKFLEEATKGDKDLIEFLQILCGYGLTGDTSEEKLVFIYGEGGNGKGTFLNTISAIAKDYAVAAAMDGFTESRNERHPTDLAKLRGSRIVTAAETTGGRYWDETRVKQLTGRDPVPARFMRQDFFDFLPQFLLLIIGNHYPKLHNITDAMRRRLRIVPFTHKPETEDIELKDKLVAEHPGILRWAIDGCLKWQAVGLTNPQIVRATTDEYFADQDIVGQWIEQDLERTQLATAKETRAALFACWSHFAEEAGEKPGDGKWLLAQMRTHGGFEEGKSNGERILKGVRIKTEAAARVAAAKCSKEKATEPITIVVSLSTETEEAIQVHGSKGAIWLPKSQVQIEDAGNGLYAVTIPRWLADKKGLGALGEEPRFRGV